MPFTIITTGSGCYKVKNTESGKLYSKKCMTKKDAIAQKMALEHAENSEEE